MKHIPVLLKETIKDLDPQNGDIIVDGTLGLAGHALAICQSAKNITLIGLDADNKALEYAKEKLKAVSAKVILENVYNDEILNVLAKHKITKIDGALFDLGMSSFQLDDSSRGFSFQKDEVLDMRMSEKGNIKASTILNTWNAETLELIFEAYGDEKYAKRIAEAIVRERQEKAFFKTSDLVNCIKANVPAWYLHRKTHPATKVFQALRVAVNDEYDRMKRAVNDTFSVLESSGRIAVITFNSLEDRYIKNLFRDFEKKNLGKRLNKKGTIPTKDEITNNPRSRSARLRTFIKE